MAEHGLLRRDEGATINERIWNAYQVVPEAFCRRCANDDAYVLVLNVEQLGWSARSLDLIDLTNVTGGMLNALLQFFVHTVTEFALETPIDIYLETVMQSEESARTNKVNDEKSLRRQIVELAYGVGGDLAAQIDAPVIDNSPLLAGCANRLPLQYRFWFLVPVGVNFPAKLAGTLKAAQELLAKYTRGAVIDAENKALAAYQRIASATSWDGSASSRFEITKLLKPYEQWAVLNSPSLLIDAISVYLGDRSLLSNETRNAALALPLDNKHNPVCLGAVFSAARAFRLLDPRTDPAQMRFSDYVGQVVTENGAHVNCLRFPCWNRVLYIPKQRHNLSMLSYFWPYYQRFNAQGRLLDARLLAAQRAIAQAAPPPAEPHPHAALLRAAEADGLELNPDDLIEGVAREAVVPNLVGGAGNEHVALVRRTIERARATLARGSLSIEEENEATTAQYLAERDYPHRFQSTHASANEDVSAINALVLEPSRYINAKVHAQRAAIDKSLAGNMEVTTLHNIAAHYERERATLRACDDPRERCIRHTLLQEAAFRDYVTSCTSPLAEGMSNTVRTINAFMQRGAAMRQDFFRPMLFFDPELSIFAHMMIRDRTTADQVYHTHSVHDLQLAIEVAQFDAYRVSRSLGFNVMGLGPPGEGKSRAIEHIEDRSIPGTLLVAARCTALAWSVSESTNDECEAYHETPRSWLIDPAECKPTGVIAASSRHNASANQGSSGTDVQQHEMFKQKITSKMLRTNENRQDPLDGSRKKLVRISECMMTYVCMSNFEVAAIASAIRSRFYIMEVANFNRGDATINDKAIAESTASREQKLLRDRCDWEYRWTQALCMHIEKGICAGWLTKPTLTALTVYLPTFVRVLEEQFGIRVVIRSLVKMELVVHHLVKRRAIFMLYQAPGAPFLNQQISLEHLPTIDMWLCDDTEIVFWTFEFMRAQYVDPHLGIVSRALRRFIAPQLGTPALFERYHRTHPGRTGNKRPASVTLHDQAAPAAPRGVSAFVHAGARAELPPTTWAAVSPGDTAYDFSRLLIQRPIESVVIELEALIGLHETVRLNRTQIMNTLEKISLQSITDHEYVPNATFDGTLTDTDLPVRPDTTRPKTSSAALETAHSLFVLHASVVFRMHEDPIEAVIKACMDATMPRRKLLRGSPHATNLPHLFGVRVTEPNPRIFHVVSNRASFVPSSLCMLGQSMEYVGSDTVVELKGAEALAENRKLANKGRLADLLRTMPVDEFSTRRRMEELNLPVEMAAAVSFAFREAQMRVDERNYVALEHRVDYPHDVDISYSQSQFVDSVRTMVAGMEERELAEYLDGRVSTVLSAFADDIRLPAMREMIKRLGFDPDVSDETMAKEAEERAELQRKREIVRADVRAAALHAAAEDRKQRQDIARLLANKRARVERALSRSALSKSTSSTSSSSSSSRMEPADELLARIAPRRGEPIEDSDTQTSSFAVDESLGDEQPPVEQPDESGEPLWD